MTLLLFQAVPGGIQIDPAWLITIVVSIVGSLSTVIAFLYRGQVEAMQAQIDFLKEEGKRKDERAEKLIDQLNRVADVQDRGLSLVEAERGRRR